MCLFAFLFAFCVLVRCPDNFIEFGSTCFHRLSSQESWSATVTACHSDTSHMLSFKSYGISEVIWTSVIGLGSVAPKQVEISMLRTKVFDDLKAIYTYLCLFSLFLTIHKVPKKQFL